MLHPLLFWVGYQRLRVYRRYAGEIMNLCRAGGFVYRDFSFRGDYAEFLCTGRHARRIREACRDRGIPVVVAADCGLPALLRRYRRRYGIFVGALLFCGILFILMKSDIIYHIADQLCIFMKEADLFCFYKYFFERIIYYGKNFVYFRVGYRRTSG